MTDTQRAIVNILDKDYQVACPPEEQDALVKAANELDKRMRAVRASGAIIGLERIAVMVALNLCHELQHMREQRKHYDPRIIQQLVDKVDEAMTAESLNAPILNTDVE